jgi:hypothetical protein
MYRYWLLKQLVHIVTTRLSGVYLTYTFHCFVFYALTTFQGMFAEERICYFVFWPPGILQLWFNLSLNLTWKDKYDVSDWHWHNRCTVWVCFLLHLRGYDMYGHASEDRRSRVRETEGSVCCIDTSFKLFGPRNCISCFISKGLF